MNKNNKKIVFLILDGLGLGEDAPNSNAFFRSDAKFLKSCFNENNPCFTKLKAHGSSVGLPFDQKLGI